MKSRFNNNHEAHEELVGTFFLTVVCRADDKKILV